MHRKENTIYIAAAVLFVLVAAALMLLLLRSPSRKAESEEPAATAVASPTPSPVPAGGLSIAGKSVDPAADAFDLTGRTLSAADCAAIASLGNLTTLSLTGCGLSDLSFLSSLGGLVTLYLPGNAITDLTPLTGLQSLRTLYLDNNPLTDLSPLSALPSLTTLSLQGVSVAEYVLEDLRSAMPGCRIFNDSALAEARPISLGGLVFTENVETLDLSNRGLYDIAKLSYCLQLWQLDLSGNPLDALSTLTGLPKLTSLALRGTGLEDGDLALLSSLSRLETLDIRDNPALSAEALELLKTALPHCEVLHDEVFFTVELGGDSLRSDATDIELPGRGIADLSGLSRFTALERLVLYGNGVSDLSPLAGLTALRELDMGYNNLSDIAALAGHTALVKLGLSHNSIRDIYALSTCTGLQELDLSYNDLGDVLHLESCTGLQRLDLTGNTMLTAEQIRRLQALLPGCAILTDIDLTTPEPTVAPLPEDAPVLPAPPEGTPVPPEDVVG